MEHFTLTSGHDMPAIGLGTYRMTGVTCTRAVRIALELGYSHIDTAALYNNHRDIAQALQGVERETLFITSKVWHSDLHYDDVLAACDQALSELRTDYLDLYLVHWPNRHIPMEGTFRALAELQTQGKIRSVGVSNFTIEHLETARDVSEVPITVNQVEYHPYLNQQALLDYCKEHEVRVTAYAPFANGRVIGDATLKEIGARHDVTSAQVALRWLLNKGMVAIPKSSSREHLAENIDVFDWDLNEDEMQAIEALDRGRRYYRPSFAEFD
jgi:diketogulonate reductase-like aldo/keto reductase